MRVSVFSFTQWLKSIFSKTTVFNSSQPITVFDVETPNHKNNRICAIGLARIEDGKITRKYYSLVNPECGFAEDNIAVHGIYPEDIADKPNFREVWSEINSYFTNSIIVAHNAVFDLNVLNKTLTAYGLLLPPIRYYDTLPLSRRFYPGLSSYSLSSLCDYCHIPLNHHNAGSDAEACAILLNDMFKKGLTESLVRDFVPAEVDADKLIESVSLYRPPTDIHYASPPFDLSNKKVVISGYFRIGTPEEVTDRLIHMGISVLSKTTLSTDAVIVGSLGSPAWKHGSYGAKIEKALEMQASGSSILIIREQDFFK